MTKPRSIKTPVRVSDNPFYIVDVDGQTIFYSECCESIREAARAINDHERLSDGYEKAVEFIGGIESRVTAALRATEGLDRDLVKMLISLRSDALHTLKDLGELDA